MKFVLFYHSLVSDWNHGNAHFLRGVVTELLDRGHDVEVFEPEDGWSLSNLREEQGETAVQEFREQFPHLTTRFYNESDLDLDAELDGADIVIVHEWNSHRLVEEIGRHRALGGDYTLLFHDTHHRSVTDPEQMAEYDLEHYDGVLAFGQVIRDLYLDRGWAQRAWTWHEAADVRVFHPPDEDVPPDAALVWIGNWGDGERTRELQEFLLEPIQSLRLRANIHGVRYPQSAIQTIRSSGAEYKGWIPNYRVPEAFSRHRVTMHVPRRPYREQLPGIPTIRVFEALACGIPLVCAPWDDCEGLFSSGSDYLISRDGREARDALHAILYDRNLAQSLKRHGWETIQNRHTCGHRVDELLAICEELRDSTPSTGRRSASQYECAGLQTPNM